jgi:hypothetical protein
MWYIRIYVIMICQHMDAWYAHQEQELASFRNNMEQYIAA